MSDDRPAEAGGDLDILRSLPASDWLTVAGVTIASAVVAFVLLEPPTAIAVVVFAALSVTVAATDARLLLIPNVLSLALFVAGVAATVLVATFQPDPFGPVAPWWATIGWSLAGAVVGAAVLAALRFAWLRTRGVEAIGFGDVKLAGALGAWLGPIDLFYAFLIAAVAGLLMGIVGQRFGTRAADGAEPGKATGEAGRLPFAALLAPAAWLVFVLVRM